jgi:hypothetical protein
MTDNAIALLISSQKKSKLEKDQAELQALTTKLEELEAAYGAELCGREDTVSLCFLFFFFFVRIVVFEESGG